MAHTVFVIPSFAKYSRATTAVGREAASDSHLAFTLLVIILIPIDFLWRLKILTAE